MRKALCAALLAGASLALSAQFTPIPWHPKAAARPSKSEGKKKPKEPQAPPMPSKYHMTFDKITTVSPGVYLAEGNVRFNYEDMLLTADAVTYDSDKGTLWATGRVAVDWRDFTLSGTELHYDLNTAKGSMRDAYGVQKEGDFTVIGGEVKKIGEDWYEVDEGTFTSCTAAVNPWAIRVSRSKFHVDHYAFLTNPRFHIHEAPILYLPYLIWPIKPDRATGLLIPEIGNSTTKGFSVNNALFIAPADWWDDTVYLDTYSNEGVGLGEEFRYVPSTSAYGWVRGYYIRQKSDDRKRWYGSWQHLQNFSNGWYAVADVTVLSDIDFLRDYQRDYTLSTLAGTDSRVFLVRSWGPYSFTSKLEQQKQYFTEGSDLTQRTLPGVEWRSSLQSLGLGAYFGFETSADAFQKEWASYVPETVKHDLKYYRADVHPSFEWPLHPFLWLDVTPRLELRATQYGQSRGGELQSWDGGPLLRSYALASAEVAGPRLVKRFKDKTKHVIEPFMRYVFVSKDEAVWRIPIFDDVDRVPVDQSVVRYGVRNRVYGDKGMLIMDSELYQDHSFRASLSYLGKDTSLYSPVSFTGRFWPTAAWSGELRLRYSILTHDLDSQSFTLAFKPKKAASDDFVRMTFLKTNWETDVSSSAGVAVVPPSEVARLVGSFHIAGEHVTFSPYLERDLRRGAWLNRRLIFWYHGSCYSVGLEAGQRTIGSFHDTQYRFLVRLKGAGTVVDFYGGTGPYSE